jgi:hypothetical protein
MNEGADDLIDFSLFSLCKDFLPGEECFEGLKVKRDSFEVPKFVDYLLAGEFFLIGSNDFRVLALRILSTLFSKFLIRFF